MSSAASRQGALLGGVALPWSHHHEDLDVDRCTTATSLPPQWDRTGLDLDPAVWGYLHRAPA